MYVFQLKEDAAYLGEMDDTYGWTCWGKTDKGEVMFNTKRQNLLAGTTLVAQEYEEKTSKKGKPYKRLKKVSIGETQEVSETVSEPSGDVLSKLNAIQGDLKLVLSFMRQLQKQDKVADVDPDKEITVDDFET